MIDAMITNTLLPAPSTEILTRMLDGEPLSSAKVNVEDAEFAFEFA